VGVSLNINYLYYSIIFICSPAPIICDMRFEEIICINPAQYHSPNEHHSIAHKQEIPRAQY
jgi:hypothetical protein